MSLNHIVSQNNIDHQLDVHFHRVESAELDSICGDDSILKMNPPTSGQTGQSLQSDGEGGLVFVSTGLGGLSHTGNQPEVGQHLQSYDTSGSLYCNSTLVEDNTKFDFGSKNLNTAGILTSTQANTNVLQTNQISSLTSTINMSNKILNNVSNINTTNLIVQNIDSSSVSYKLPSQGTSTQILSSQGDGTLGWQNLPSFTGVQHTGINPVSKQYTCYSSIDPNLITNGRLRETSSFDLSCDGLNVNNISTLTADNLVQRNIDGSYINLKLPNVGTDLQYISSDGMGNVKWHTPTEPPQAVDYLDPSPSTVNAFAKYIDTLGNVQNSSVVEAGGNVDFSNQNLTNVQTTNTQNLNVSSIYFPSTIPADIQTLEDKTQNISSYSAGDTTFSGIIHSKFDSGGTLAQYVSGTGDLVTPSNSQQSNIYQYRTQVNSGIPPPLSGRILYGLTQSLIVNNSNTLYISHLTDDNVDIENFLYNISISNQIYIQDKTISGNYQIWNVSGAINIIVGSYIQVPVKLSSGTVIFANNHQIIMAVLLNTTSIDGRLDVLEAKTGNQTGGLLSTTFSGDIIAGSIINTAYSGSNYFLKSDGTVDTNTYLLPATAAFLYATISSLSDYLTIALASSTYLTQSNAASTYALISSLNNYLTTANAALTYLTQSSASTTYLTQSSASSTYLTQSSASTTYALISSLNNYLTTASAALTYLTQSSASSTYLSQSSAASTYATISSLNGLNLSNEGSGTYSLIGSTSANPSFKVKTITAGSNITITDSSNILTINSIGGGGGTYTFSNGGMGTTLVSSTSTSTDFKPVGLVAGANVAISNSGTDITISASGSSGTNTINLTSIATSASTYYPIFASVVSGNVSTLSTDSGGLSYIPTDNRLTVGAVNSGIFTSSVVPPSVGFVGHVTSAAQIQTTGVPTSASIFYPTFVATSTSNTAEVLSKDGGLSYIPTDNKLMTSIFEGTTFNGTGLISTISFVGTSTNAQQITTTGNTSSASTFYPTFVASSSSVNNESVYKDGGLSYIPSTNALSCDIVNAITFNSSTAIGSAGFVGTSSQALKLAQTAIPISASPYYLLFSPSSITSTGEAMAVDNGLSYIPTTNVLTAGGFSGPLSGNATTATNVALTGTNNLLVQTGSSTTALLGNGTAGQFLQSNGTSLPTWVANSTLGFQMSFGGKSILVGDYLQPNRFADPAATSLITSTYQTRWLCPTSCNLTAWSSSVQTTSASAILAIYLDGVLQNSLSGVGSAITNTGTLSRAITSGQYLDVRINTAIIGACCITLYFT